MHGRSSSNRSANSSCDNAMLGIIILMSRTICGRENLIRGKKVWITRPFVSKQINGLGPTPWAVKQRRFLPANERTHCAALSPLPVVAADSTLSHPPLHPSQCLRTKMNIIKGLGSQVRSAKIIQRCISSAADTSYINSLHIGVALASRLSDQSVLEIWT